jgi:hypothetical protein
MKFITYKNGVITGVHSGDVPMDKYSWQGFYCHEIAEVPETADVRFGDSLDFYDSAWVRRPDAALISEGLLPLPGGYVIEGQEVREMTNDEKIIAGLIPPPAGQKVAEGKLVSMTMADGN